MASEPYTPELVRFRASWLKDVFDNFAQHVTEALSILFSSLEDAEARVLPPGLPAGIWELIGVRSLQRLTCNHCGNTSLKNVQNPSIALDIPLQPQLVDHLLTQYWGEQVLKDRDDPYRCLAGRCGAGSHVQKFEDLVQWPPVLVLTLKRWAFTQNIPRKNNTKVHHGERLRIADQSNHYRLCGLIEHHE